MRNRQHVNVNARAFLEFAGEMPRISDDSVVEVEIGCADAQFLFERATLHPERQFIGLEIREPLVKAVNRRAREEGAPVQAISVHANHHLAKLFPKGRVRHCYLNFPDPWFKRRHHDRRMVNQVLLRQVHQILEPNGDVLMQSDVFDVALDALSEFEACDDIFENMAGSPWSFWKEGNPFGVRSWREMNAEETGLSIWRMRYRPRAVVT